MAGKSQINWQPFSFIASSVGAATRPPDHVVGERRQGEVVGLGRAWAEDGLAVCRRNLPDQRAALIGEIRQPGVDNGPVPLRGDQQQAGIRNRVFDHAAGSA